MEFLLLGPMEVRLGTEVVALGGHKPRVLLATLLINNGRVVPTARLVDAIWGDEPPESARALVQTYIAGLRRALAVDGRDFIITRSPGYLLRAEPGELDLHQFERLAQHGRTAAAQGRLDDAAAAFDRALALWRGPALSGMTSHLIVGDAARLDELHLTTLEDRLTVDLQRGRHEEVVAELTGLVGRHPTREPLRRLLMLALYRSDRRAEALAVFREGRRVLIEESGIEPGPSLRGLHEAILSGQDIVGPGPPAAGTSARPHDPPAVGQLRPAQLPPVPADFVGRDAETATLLAALGPRVSATSLPTAVITGKGGVGKSTLAVYIGHRLASAFPDGQLFVQLYGMTTTPAAPETVLGRFLAALGDPPDALPATLEARVERFRSLVAGRRILVVLDDAANEQQVRPLLPGAPTCAVLVTSRSRLPGLAGVCVVELGALATAEARELLGRIAGRQRIDAEADAADRLAELCGRLPLAVRIIGTRLANRRHWSVASLSDRLGDEERRLDELRVGDQTVRASLSLSYEALDAPAQVALRRLGLLGPDFPSWVVAALLGVEEDQAEEVVEHLVDVHLVDFVTTDGAGQARYRLHDLLRLYAVERAQRDDDAAALADAVRRVLRGWIQVVDRIAVSHLSGSIVLRPRQSPDGQWTPAVAGVAVRRPAAWFDAEQLGLIASVELAAAMDLDDVAAPLASALSGTRFATGNLFDAWSRTHDAALACVRRTGNRPAEAALLAELGQLRFEQDRFTEAQEYLGQALTAFREIADARGEAAALAAMGTTCRERADLSGALVHLRRARALLATLDDVEATASVRRSAASVHLELGDFAAAHREAGAALAGFRAIGSQRGEAMALRSISLVYRAEGQYGNALGRAVQAVAIFEEIGDDLLWAYGIQAAGKARIRLGAVGDTQLSLNEALRVCRVAGDRFGQALMLRTLGELHQSEGRLAEAAADLRAALRLWDALDVPMARARTLRDLARVDRAAGDEAAALARYGEAIAIAERHGAREVAELIAERAEPAAGIGVADAQPTGRPS